MRKRIYVLVTLFLIPAFCLSSVPASAASAPLHGKLTAHQQQFLNKLERDTFDFFWNTPNPKNGLTPDRFPDNRLSSVAAVGFSLTAYLVGAQRHYITRAQAAQRTLTTLQFLKDAPQGPESRHVAGYKGFFYHFLDMDSGARVGDTELSSIDTALLMAGVLSAQTYFDADNPTEARIRSCADILYRRIVWPWFYDKQHKPLLNMGWYPEKGYTDACWSGYNEGMILYILALGSPTHPISPDSWGKWTDTYKWETYYDHSYVNFGPLFGHQYSQAWIDFRGIQDDYMRSKGIDYFINSRRATYAGQAYCIDNPNDWKGYGQKVWGLTASDGPMDAAVGQGEDARVYHRYWARGAGAAYLCDDGTIAPTAVGGSIPFAPDITIPTLRHLKDRFGNDVYGEYGFKDAFNLSYTYDSTSPDGWFDNQYIAIDQGPILLMIENYRTGFIWNLMKENKYIKKGLEQAGFTGGWLNS